MKKNKIECKNFILLRHRQISRNGKKTLCSRRILLFLIAKIKFLTHCDLKNQSILYKFGMKMLFNWSSNDSIDRISFYCFFFSFSLFTLFLHFCCLLLSRSLSLSCNRTTSSSKWSEHKWHRSVFYVSVLSVAWTLDFSRSRTKLKQRFICVTVQR